MPDVTGRWTRRFQYHGASSPLPPGKSTRWAVLAELRRLTRSGRELKAAPSGI